MASNNTPSNPNDGKRANPSGAQPGWTKGLRQLYDSVVEEPLPDDFQDLLDKLDRDDA